MTKNNNPFTGSLENCSKLIGNFIYLLILTKKYNYSTAFAINNTYWKKIFCREDRTRTCGLMVPNHPIYQLIYFPRKRKALGLSGLLVECNE